MYIIDFGKGYLFFECQYSNESFLDQMHKYRSLFLRSKLLINNKKATEYDKNFQKHEIDYFDLYHLESESRYNKQSALKTSSVNVY
jgi:diketogulonate reductase-like aldo/keto reductase